MENTDVQESLRILHLEDDPHDAEIVRAMLENERIECVMRRVDNRKGYESALGAHQWDLIISDYALPSYNGMKALELARERAPATPFILFSGTIGEETAVLSLKNGAADYILKERPARLVSAVKHALAELQERKRRKRVEAELLKSEQRKQELEAQFLRMQRMESIGALVGGVAHDLNNALAPVLMGIGFLRSENLSPQARQILSTMEASSRRGADMLKQVLTFARGVEGNEVVININLLLREMETIVRDTFPKSIHWRGRFPNGLWSVSGFSTQIYQVLMNLCINARDAMPNGGQLTLTAENVIISEKPAGADGNVALGPYLLITVADTGSGMSPEVLERIFEPFFTTKELGKGTGLGLSTSLDIIQNHNGFLTVESAPGKGTRFSLHLPALVTAPTAEMETKNARLPTGKGEWILVVDDEVAICEITKVTLENYGYNVCTAGNGPEALALFVEKRNQFELVLTDTEMPFMDGRATCLALRKIDPHLKIIVASGSSQGKEDDDTAFRINTCAFIPKPYTADRLLTTVHQVLSKK
ncbi:MAG: hybrid sensor histidine kinase/response regulator [Verrucomicrobiota bacterium]